MAAHTAQGVWFTPPAGGRGRPPPGAGPAGPGCDVAWPSAERVVFRHGADNIAGPLWFFLLMVITLFPLLKHKAAVARIASSTRVALLVFVAGAGAAVSDAILQDEALSS